ncbi:hypothetical protein BKA82DRAFT_18143 [Pisolithus tinctorius]|uniref:Uncharacterized protein n=1 Tax=Pisolithus tinctorius Marx 270 TaxID=870435 RepID=A0A0C3KWJ7_PISTI|nr:hypothetical protein BKA82DRAFT_18143 [Pisolithus tinctorius]KIO13867.1 hypothetical protein M404DRAFT_18143 [Pisolithus tinctorius Marx 270]
MALPAFGSSNGTTTTIVLENLTYGFHKPCILDVELGTILYDEDVPPAKWSVYRLVDVQELSDHSGPVLAPRRYGKTIKPEHLPDRRDLTWTCRLRRGVVQALVEGGFHADNTGRHT